ncbi:MAG: DUF1573 domain-containing protein [Chitinophagales bacterium]
MRKIIPILFLTLISLSSMAQEKTTMKEVLTTMEAKKVEGPSMKFEKTHHDFGDISLKEGKVTYEFSFINDGTEPLIIKKAKGSCGCTAPKVPRNRPIMPGESETVKVVFNPKGKSGKIRKTVTLTHNSAVSGESAETVITIGGKIVE